jgi:hypothetical protein
MRRIYAQSDPAVIPLPITEFAHNTNGHPLRPTWAHSRKPMDLMVSGIVMRLFQASQVASMMAL